MVIFAACTAARIGEVAGVRVSDTSSWTWTVRRQTTPAPGGVIDKGTKGKRGRRRLADSLPDCRPVPNWRVVPNSERSTKNVKKTR